MLGEWVVEGEGASLECLGSVGAAGWWGEGAVVEVDSWGTGLPYQALEGAGKDGRQARKTD